MNQQICCVNTFYAATVGWQAIPRTWYIRGQWSENQCCGHRHEKDITETDHYCRTSQSALGYGSANYFFPGRKCDNEAPEGDASLECQQADTF